VRRGLCSGDRMQNAQMVWLRAELWKEGTTSSYVLESSLLKSTMHWLSGLGIVLEGSDDSAVEQASAYCPSPRFMYG
jgi:hypothetical protein